MGLQREMQSTAANGEGAAPISSPLRRFLNAYPNWQARLIADAPVYCLPHKLIHSLSAAQNNRGPVLSKQHRKAETGFTELCCELNCIGLTRGAPIFYPYLSESREGPTEAVAKHFRWTDSQQATIANLLVRTKNIQRRLKGYVGWLVLDPGFCESRDRLAALWNSLSESDRPRFPLASIIFVPGVPGPLSAPSERLTSFQEQLREFLARWGLTRMVNWELPEPQGPLIPALMKIDAPSMPKHGLHIVLPIHYPLTRDDLLVEEIRLQQQQLAREAEHDPTIAGMPHFIAYSNMFDVYHFESVVRQRYGRGGGGFILSLEKALADALGLTVSNVQRLRRAISAIRRGKRSSVAWLRVKPNGRAV